jgi:hypothetical protein
MLRVTVIYCFNCGYTSIVRQRVRDVGFEAPAILQLGLERLLQGGITDFNMRMSYISGLLYNPYEDGFNEATDNMLEDFQMLGLMVRFCLNILIEFFLLILTLASV